MKHVYKLTPVSMYDVRGLEQWLEQLAAKGLFLKKYRPLVCTFEKGEPKQVRYRLEPYPYSLAVDFPDDMVELFQECGWRHVGEVNHEMLIFSCADPHAPEPHTDPDIQLEQWNKLYQKARKDFFLMGLFFLGCLAVCAGALFWGGTPLARLLASDILVLEFLLFLFLRPLLELAVYYSRARELAAVIRELEGQPKKRRLWFPSRQFFSWLVAVLVTALTVLLVFLLLHPNWGSSQQITTDFSILSLSELERDQPSERREFYAYLTWSPLSWNQWYTWDFEDGSILFLRWFDLPDGLSFLAVPAARDLLADSMKLDEDALWTAAEPVSWTTREHPEVGADWLSVADSEDGVYHTAAAALGDKVVLVRYVGSGDLADYLEEIVDMIR